MSAETESLPISALQHFAFCPRQFALIHIERQWAENRLTAEGRVLHDKAHEGGSESRRDVRIARALPLQSTTLHLHGVADIVEFHYAASDSHISNPRSQIQSRLVAVVPVEYKRGRPKHEPIDSIQLCAQAICLEEMLHFSIPAGAIFYGATHRRHDVAFDDALRTETRRIVQAALDLIDHGKTPAPEYAPKCRSCSLFELCRPESVTHSASRHLEKLMNPRD